jgi:hypothetical protein
MRGLYAALCMVSSGPTDLATFRIDFADWPMRFPRRKQQIMGRMIDDRGRRHA